MQQPGYPEAFSCGTHAHTLQLLNGPMVAPDKNWAWPLEKWGSQGSLNQAFIAFCISCFLHATIVSGLAMQTSADPESRPSAIHVHFGNSRAIDELSAYKLGKTPAKPRTEATAHANGRQGLPLREPSLDPGEAGTSDFALQLQTPSTTFYSAQQVDRPAQPIGAPDLSVLEAASFGLHGRVELLLRIDAQGRVLQVDIERDELTDTNLATLSKEIFSQVTFAPAELNGRPVGQATRIEVNFQ